jgi:phospholipid-binding lipoprotein MlaA
VIFRFITVALLAGVFGCATNPDRDPRDPWEPMNRRINSFNEVVDENLARPVAQAYRDNIHVEIRTRIANFFANLADPFIGVNNILQAKLEEGLDDFGRFLINTTIGLFGIHDVATEAGLEKHNEDFGQTFGRWGAGPGPYLVIPLLGPSNVRDAAGTAVDWYTDPTVESVRPIRLRNTLYGLRFVNARAELLDASKLLEEAALDKYVFLRDAYLQRRRSLVYDGRAPRERDAEVNEQPEKAVK